MCCGDYVEIGIDQAGRQAVDAHDQIWPLGGGESLVEKSRRAFPCLRLSVKRNRVLEVDDQRVGAARHRLVELLRTISGDEQKRAHGLAHTPREITVIVASRSGLRQ